MPTSLSNLVDNLLEINEEECKACMMDKILNQNLILLDIKIIICVSNVKNVIKDG